MTDNISYCSQQKLPAILKREGKFSTIQKNLCAHQTKPIENPGHVLFTEERNRNSHKTLGRKQIELQLPKQNTT